MKPFILFCLILLASCGGFAQNYRPFLEEKLHYFASGVNYSVRIDSSGEIGGDSAFWMNEVAITPSANCITNYNTHFVPGQEGLFADHFISHADGSYQFVTRAGDTATFHTQLPTGLPWPFLSDSNLTATISARIQSSVAGQVDSVLMIDISDGKQYQLSQNYGLASGPNLSYYLRNAALRAASLAELPMTPDFKDFFAWWPGDVYNFREVNQPAWITYVRFDILDRTESPDGDSLIFTIKHRRQRHWLPSPIEPISVDTLRLVYTRQEMRYMELATGEADTSSLGYHLQNRWVYDPYYHNRLTLVCNYLSWPGTMDSCGYSYPMTVPPCNGPLQETVTMGLGTVYYNTVAGQTMTTCLYETHTMVCYEQAGWDSVGPCPDELIVLDRPEAMPSAQMTLIRQSQTSEMSVRWEGLAAGRYQWQLYDLNGRLLRNEEVTMNENGEQKIPQLGSAGMYLLRIQNADGSWAQTLRIPLVMD